VVSRIITDLCVFDVKPDGTGLELIELADGVTLDEVAAKTEATYTVSQNLKAAA
ncbi:MAG: succinyl-CoA--3-ketoacid-CoA transferase, partial [Brevundimonas sp.]